MTDWIRTMNAAHGPIVTKSKLINDLHLLGVRPGQTIMLHASVKSIGWVVGGPDVVLQAILDVLTPEGTLMMYVSWEEWERSLVFGLEHLSTKQQGAYRRECPPFDAATSRAQRAWSILTEYLRTWPGACRSNHPTASVAAVGAQARWLTEDHPLAYGYGAGSPFDKFCQLDGRILLLGSPLNTVTLLHYAEHLARVPNKRVVVNHAPLMQNGERVWVSFEEFDTCEGIRPGYQSEDYFGTILQAYLDAGHGQHGKVGAADSYLFEGAHLAGFAIQWLEQTWNK